MKLPNIQSIKLIYQNIIILIIVFGVERLVDENLLRANVSLKKKNTFNTWNETDGRTRIHTCMHARINRFIDLHSLVILQLFFRFASRSKLVSRKRLNDSKKRNSLIRKACLISMRHYCKAIFHKEFAHVRLIAVSK